MKQLSVTDRILLLFTAILAAYQIAVGIDGAPAMLAPPGRDYAGDADCCSSSEGSVEATRRHAWGCWA